MAVDNYNLFRDPTIKDVERAEEHKQHAHALNPVRRTGRNLEQLGHSSLIKHFLGLQQIERQKNVALAIPLTSNDGFPTPAEELSSAMKHANISLQESNVTLNVSLSCVVSIYHASFFSRLPNKTVMFSFFVPDQPHSGKEELLANGQQRAQGAGGEEAEK